MDAFICKFFARHITDAEGECIEQFVADSVDEVSFSESDAAVDEEGIIGIRGFCSDGLCGADGAFIGTADDKVIERIAVIEVAHFAQFAGGFEGVNGIVIFGIIVVIVESGGGGRQSREGGASFFVRGDVIEFHDICFKGEDAVSHERFTSRERERDIGISSDFETFKGGLQDGFHRRSQLRFDESQGRAIRQSDFPMSGVHITTCHAIEVDAKSGFNLISKRFQVARPNFLIHKAHILLRSKMPKIPAAIPI